jgi:hypothetical protein
LPYEIIPFKEKYFLITISKKRDVVKRKDKKTSLTKTFCYGKMYIINIQEVKPMKKLISIILTSGILLSAVACGGNRAPEKSSVPESLKILAVGNSFSDDAMEYLYQMLEQAGVREIVLGNLYHAGCSLEQHLDFAVNDKPEYEYRKNVDGSWKTVDNYVLCNAVFDEEWDYITFQQTSKTCGLAESYAPLTELIDYIESLDVKAKFVWHSTWAYQQDSTHKSFPNYDNSQQKMYDMTIGCLTSQIETESRIDFTIPCTTSVQNARTSFMGDTLTRDGYHLDKNIGRYIAALTWCCKFTGASATDITYNPAPEIISESMLAAAQEAVNNAIKTPKAVTSSTVTEGIDSRF